MSGSTFPADSSLDLHPSGRPPSLGPPPLASPHAHSNQHAPALAPPILPMHRRLVVDRRRGIAQPPRNNLAPLDRGPLIELDESPLPTIRRTRETLDPDEPPARRRRRLTQRLADAIFRNSPPWLVSFVFHLAAMILLALLWLTPEVSEHFSLDVTFADQMGEQLDVDDLQMAFVPAELDEQALITPHDLPLVDDPIAAPEQVEIVPLSVAGSSAAEAPRIGLALSGREVGRKDVLLRAFGGNAKTEAAVTMALEWLKRNQSRHGSWALDGPYSDGGEHANREAATAMALLAFQGAGNTHQKGAFRTQVTNGWRFLVLRQDADGNFFQEGGPPSTHRLYTQAQATIAICELYGMTKDEDFRAPAQLALDYAVAIQDAKGGWRYRPNNESDLSVTGWFVMALQSGIMAGLHVPSQTLENVNGFLDSVAVDDGARYSYLPRRAETPAMTAEGLLCRQYLGWEKEDDRLRRGVDYIRRHPIDWRSPDIYYWYYATQVLHHLDGPEWESWNVEMRESLPAQQVKEGRERGSWHSDRDRWVGAGGRLFNTCLATYMLEVYYRHLPIYHRLY